MSVRFTASTDQYIRPVRRGHHSHARELFDTVHLVEQTCKDAGVSAITVPCRAEGINLVLRLSKSGFRNTCTDEKDDGRRSSPSFAKDLPD